MRGKQRQRKIDRQRFPFYVYLGYLLVCTLLLTGVSFSRYVSTAEEKDSGCVAAGMMNVTCDSDKVIEITPPIEGHEITDSFIFRVSNKLSEVAFDYEVIVTLDEKLPDGITMEMDGKAFQQTDSKNYKLEQAGTFEAGKQENKVHTISFTGDYQSGGVDKESQRQITIVVRAEQID